MVYLGDAVATPQYPRHCRSCNTDVMQTSNQTLAVLIAIASRPQVSHLLAAVIGIGSACFHCTLRHVEQQCDETPMVLSQLNWFHELFADMWESNTVARTGMPVLLVLYGLVSKAKTETVVTVILRH